MNKLPPLLAAMMILLPAAAMSEEIICPPMPEAISAVTHDVTADIQLDVGSLGKFKSAQLLTKGSMIAHNVYEKYPDIARDFLTQTMASTYCSMLKASSLTPAQMGDRWVIFASKVLKLPIDTSPVGGTASKIRAGDDGRASTIHGHQGSGRSISSTNSLNAFDSSIRFEVGTDRLDTRSENYLRHVAMKLATNNSITISLEPIRSKALSEDGFSSNAIALYKGRQLQVRQVLMRWGFPSDQIVFLNDRYVENTVNDRYDSDNRPIESGLNMWVTNSQSQ